MSVYLNQSHWDEYAKIQSDFWNDNAEDILIWDASLGTVPRFGEDQRKNRDKKELRCLFQYNSFRTWPVNILGDTGVEDKQSQVAILSYDYLKSIDLLDEQGNFAYDVTQDTFYHQGVAYEATGDTHVAQAGKKPLFLYIILKRYNGQKVQAN